MGVEFALPRGSLRQIRAVPATPNNTFFSVYGSETAWTLAILATKAGIAFSSWPQIGLPVDLFGAWHGGTFPDQQRQRLVFLPRMAQHKPSAPYLSGDRWPKLRRHSQPPEFTQPTGEGCPARDGPRRLDSRPGSRWHLGSCGSCRSTTRRHPSR